MNLRHTVLRMVDWGGGLKASPTQLAGLFAATVIVRNLLEASSLGNLFEGPAFFLHFPVAYVFPLLTLSALLHLASGYPLGKLMRIMILAWTLTLLPPLIDLLLGVKGDIGYFPLQKENARWFLLHFFHPGVSLPGTTAGIRIEAFIGCVLAGVFAGYTGKRRPLLRGVLTTLGFMPVFLVFFTWPYLVHLLGEQGFPAQEATQGFLQWRSLVESPLHGTAHFTLFIVDMVPVSLLSLWMLVRLAPGQWSRLRGEAGRMLPLLTVAAAGTLAAVLGAPEGGFTFADAAGLAGALLAVLWMAASRHLQGSYRTTALAVSLCLAWASGWNTVVFLALGAALLHLPGPAWLSRGFTAPVFLYAALSPAGFPRFHPGFALLLLSALLAGVLAGFRRSRVPAGILVLALPWLIPLEGMGEARVQATARQADSFFRSGMIAHAHASASHLAGFGGGFRQLAEAAQLNGMHARARWAYRVGTALGDSSVEMLKVGVNLAVMLEDSLLLWNRALHFMEVAGEQGFHAADVLLGFAASRGDTASLATLHSREGFSERMLLLYSRAFLALGDTVSAVAYSRAALSAPRSRIAAWSWALDLAGKTGGNPDSLYALSVEQFGFSLETALARIQAGGAHLGPLVERCLHLAPGSSGVLETAALWHLNHGDPETAMHCALRAVAVQNTPGDRALALAVRASSEAGRPDIATACEQYRQSLLR